mgnify:CR=1 FL=1
MRCWIPWLTALVIIVADRLSKAAILEHLAHGQWREVFPGLTLTHVRNPGIAFSLFADGGPLTRVLLHLVILTAVVVIAWMVVRHPRHRVLAGFAFGLILGGAVGNLVDRVRLGHVTDFIQVWFGNWAFPSFNVADSAISVGAALLILNSILITRSHRHDDSTEPVADDGGSPT